MLLANPHFSHIYSYIEAINKIKNASFNCAYKSDEVTKGDTIYFKCFDLESTIQLNPESLFASSIIVKDARYSGTLSFSYNKTTKQIFIDTVPYVICGATKVPLFTSDIARIVREKIERITPIAETHIVFKDPILVLAEDASVIDVLPQVKETSNHKFFTNAMAEIEREKEIIAADIAKCKRRADRKTNEEERIFRRKRSIYGIDPEGLTMDEFKRKLGENLAKKYESKLKGLQKSLEKCQKRFNEMFIKDFGREDKKHLHNYEIFLLYVVLSKISRNIDFEDSPIELGIMRQYDSYTEKQKQKLIEQLKEKFPDKSKTSTIELLEYLRTLQTRSWQIKDNDLAIEHMLKVLDEYNKYAIKHYNSVMGYINTYLIDWNDQYSAEMQGRDNPTFESEDRAEFIEAYFTSYINSAIEYHPILGKIYNIVQGLKKEYGKDHEKIRAKIRKRKLKVPELGIMISRARLQDKIDYYTELLKNPPMRIAEIFLERFVTWDKKSWGLLLKAPYFREIQIGDKHDDYGLMMIRPGVERFEIDDFNQEYLDKINGLVNYIDTSKCKGRRDTKNSNIYDYIHTSWNLRAIAYYIITIPDSLDDESIRTLTGYTDESSQVIYVCQSNEAARRAKKVLMEMNLRTLDRNCIPYGDANVIVDPNYYSNFVVSSPKVDELFKKYSAQIKKPYGISFSERIKYLYVFCYNLSVTGVQNGRITVDTHYLYNVLNEIAFGGYHNDRVYIQELREFIEFLKDPKYGRVDALNEYTYNMERWQDLIEGDESIEYIY